MARSPIGHRIRKRRQELGLAQKTVAGSVGISASYLNLIEHNKRPIGGTLAHRIATALALDSRALAGTEEARLVAELSEIADDLGQINVDLPADPADLVATRPEAARAILGLYRAFREAKIKSELIGQRLGDTSFLVETSHQILSLITTVRSHAEILKDFGDLSPTERARFATTLVTESERLAERAVAMFEFIGGRGLNRPSASPSDEVEDFISDRANYFPQLEAAAEAFIERTNGGAAPTAERLADYLTDRHRIRVTRAASHTLPPGGEVANPSAGTFVLSDALARPSVRFRLARLIATIEQAPLIGALVAGARLTSPEAEVRLRRVLAGVMAAAVVMPYEPFRAAAERLRMDVLEIARAFEVSFEQACHRLTTLRRPGLEGVPLHFLRVDIAGNISKRFSASGLTLPRYGGACPRWVVHHAFAMPGRVLTEVASLPDGETYLFIARADPPQRDGGAEETNHAVMIGASIAYAGHFAYADTLNLASPKVAVPVGVTCRLCPRDDCAQRAFDRFPGFPWPGAAKPVR